jgi:hypothetical protein
MVLASNAYGVGEYHLWCSRVTVIVFESYLWGEREDVRE